MKKQGFIQISVILIMGMLFGTMISAQCQSNNENVFNTVSFEDARLCVEQFLKKLNKDQFVSIQSHKSIINPSNNQLIGYLFLLSPHGFVITSASTQVTPILTYSFTSDAPSIHDNNPLLNLLSVHVDAEQRNHLAYIQSQEGRYIKEWKSLLKADFETKTTMLFEQWPPEGSTTTEGWIQTQWHQEEPYNNFCPIDPDTKERTLAGCPAITMGQILVYHQTIHETQFNDSDDYQHRFMHTFWIDNDYETFDFPSFPMLNSYLVDVENHFQENVALTDEDVAAISFACGVAAEQVYSVTVSGTYGVDQAYDAYQRFSCEQATLYYKPDNTIFDIIKDNIKNGLPVHFAVVTPGWDAGHNLIIDGYNTDDFYHLNFGWGGSYDGWYHLPDDLPYDLTVIEGVIVDIEKRITTENLDVIGSFQWPDKTGGEMVNDTFTIRNIGEPGSLLSWQIESIPEWGEWTVTPDSALNITPEDGEVVVSVSCILPDKRGKEYSDSITIINTENPSDRDFVPISLSVSKQKYGMQLWQQLIQEWFPFFNHLFQ